MTRGRGEGGGAKGTWHARMQCLKMETKSQTYKQQKRTSHKIEIETEIDKNTNTNTNTNSRGEEIEAWLITNVSIVR